MSDIVASVLCWVNTSRDTDKSTVWLKPVQNNGLLKTSVFLNLPTRASQRRFADYLRANYGTFSYQLMLDLGDIRSSKSGSLGVSMDFESLRRALVVVKNEDTEPNPAEEEFFNSLPGQAGPSSDSSEKNDDYDF